MVEWSINAEEIATTQNDQIVSIMIKYVGTDKSNVYIHVVGVILPSTNLSLDTYRETMYTVESAIIGTRGIYNSNTRAVFTWKL